MKKITYFEDGQAYRYCSCGKIARYEEGGVLLCEKCRKKARLAAKLGRG